MYKMAFITLDINKIIAAKSLFYLSRHFCPTAVAMAAAVGTRGGADVLMQTVEEPKQELQGIMLGVSPELGAVLGYNHLEKGSRGEGRL